MDFKLPMIIKRFVFASLLVASAYPCWCCQITRSISGMNSSAKAGGNQMQQGRSDK